MLYPVAGQRCVYTRLYRSIPALAIELTSTLERGEDWKHCAQLKRKWQIKWENLGQLWESRWGVELSIDFVHWSEK